MVCFFLFYLTCGPGCLEVITSGSHEESSVCCRMYQAQVAFGSDVQIWKQVSWHYWSQIFVVVERQIYSAAELNLKYQIEFWLSQIIFGLHSQLILCLSEQDECHWNVTNSTNKLSIHCLSLSKTFWTKRKNWQINTLESESNYMCHQDFAKSRKEHWGRKARHSASGGTWFY